MLDKEFKYFKDHQNELVKEYNGKYIGIVGDQVVGSYDSEFDAYVNLKKEYKPGTFLIQHCVSGTRAYTQTFHSRVAFE